MLDGGAMVNALAFSGSNYLFSMLRSSDLNEERKRHGEVTRLTGKKPSDAIKAEDADTKALLCSPWPPSWPQRAKSPLPRGSAFATFTSPVNWRVVAGGPLTRYGLLKCTGWDAR